MARADQARVKVISLKLIYLLFLMMLLACSGAPERRLATEVAGGPDIVFDLDWTLIGEVKDPSGAPASELLHFEHETYRLLPGARELLERLASLPVRISFFSGGGRERNEAVLKQITVGEGSAYDLAFKVLSRDDLTDLSHLVGEEARFSERYKKDLTKINSHLSAVMMIDDNFLFAPNEAQRGHYLWLGETFANFETYESVRLSEFAGKYRPTSYVNWLSSRIKLAVVEEILLTLLERGEEKWNVTELQRLARESGLESGRWSALKSRALARMPELAPVSCEQRIELLLVN